MEIVSTKEKFHGEVQRFMKKKKMTDTQFSRAFCNDGGFIRKLRRPEGLIYTKTVDKCRAWMKENK